MNIGNEFTLPAGSKGADMFSLRDQVRPDKPSTTESSRILAQLDSLIDELLNNAELSSSSLASILMAARESVQEGYHIALARRIWDASNDLKLRQTSADSAPDSLRTHGSERIGS
jgi:hypothetical protein